MKSNKIKGEKDKMSDGFRQIIGWGLSQISTIGRRCHAKLGPEVAGEGIGICKTAGLAHLLNGKLGLLVHQAHGVVQAHLADEGGETLVAAALGESGTDALLRETCAVDERLAFKLRVEEQLLALDEVAEIGEKVGVRGVFSWELRVISWEFGVKG